MDSNTDDGFVSDLGSLYAHLQQSAVNIELP